jgi:hypothetical protein
MTLDRQTQLSEKINEIRRAMNAISKPHPLGHAFVWGSVPLVLKNGKTKYYRTCIASVCAENLDQLIDIAHSMGAKNCTYNLD